MFLTCESLVAVTWDDPYNYHCFLLFSVTFSVKLRWKKKSKEEPLVSVLRILFQIRNRTIWYNRSDFYYYYYYYGIDCELTILNSSPFYDKLPSTTNNAAAVWPLIKSYSYTSWVSNSITQGAEIKKNGCTHTIQPLHLTHSINTSINSIVTTLSVRQPHAKLWWTKLKWCPGISPRALTLMCSILTTALWQWTK